LNGTENNNPTENPDNASRATRGLGFISENFRDQYHPFIRVSNYLREGNAFYIELGYYRYRCSNGMMLGRKTQTTFRHSYYVNSFKSIQIAVMEQFLRHKHSFMYMAENLWKLLLVYIPKAKMRLTSFDIFEKELLRRSIEERMELQLKLNELIDKYVLEIGENLNAALNVATDFSKLLEGNKVSQSHIQNLGSIWANRVSERSFNIEKYFADLSDIEERIMTHQINIEEEELI
jgi:CRISPR/Cas system-associated protein endoribonuclease Cas2